MSRLSPGPSPGPGVTRSHQEATKVVCLERIKQDPTKLSDFREDIEALRGDLGLIEGLIKEGQSLSDNLDFIFPKML